MTHRPPSSNIESAARREVLDQVAAKIPCRDDDDDACVLVGIDGPDGSGKTILADQLAAALRRAGRPVLRISLDDFHNTRERRYRRGRESPIGFWLDSYNYERFVGDVLDPLGPFGNRRYRSVAHDLVTDQILDPPWQQAQAASVVVIDGLFLHRDELADRWDFSVFLAVAFEITAARMALRDGTAADPEHASMRRYVDAQRIYYSECSPKTRATVVIDNADLDAPKLQPHTVDRDADPTDLTIEIYAAEADGYLANSAPPPPEVRRYLDDFAALSDGDRVLELGSGPGWEADYLEQHGMTLERTDASPTFVERLRVAGHDARVLDARSDDYGGRSMLFSPMPCSCISVARRPKQRFALLAAQSATRACWASLSRRATAQPGRPPSWGGLDTLLTGGRRT